ncbi:MAG: S41 family peptidase [Bacteroidales bacterium]
MRNIISFLAVLLTISFPACVEEPQFANTPQGNFEACWKILNEKYCFFSYKKEEYGLDWDEVYERYSRQIGADIKRDSLFKVLNNMMGELRDGHVNLYTPFNVGRYWTWFQDYPRNFDANIQRYYLGNDYMIAGGVKYTVLPDSIGYIYYGSFSSPVGESNLDYILAYLHSCKGIIIDVRDNGGGSLTQVNTIAGRFTNERLLSGYIQHKTGKGHDDFSDLYPMYLDPSARIHYNKPVALLTNRSVFSAANNFVSVMKLLPQVITVGDRTGGGSGLPFSSELPNGWSIRFSASPIYDAEKRHTEFGIDPDVKVDMRKSDIADGIDTIIEKAREILSGRF